MTEQELQDKQEIETSFGETLSWKYLCYVRDNPILWNTPTNILYAGHDNLTSYETISEFTDETSASLTIMEDGEHWFHTSEFIEDCFRLVFDEIICSYKKYRSSDNI